MAAKSSPEVWKHLYSDEQLLTNERALERDFMRGDVWFKGILGAVFIGSWEVHRRKVNEVLEMDSMAFMEK